MFRVAIIIFTVHMLALSYGAGAEVQANTAEQSKSSQSALSEYEKTLIALYTATAYESVNSSSTDLVDGGVTGLTGPMLPHTPEKEELNYKFYHQLKEATAKLPAYEGKVYRGIYTSSDPAKRYIEGQVYSERRFQSATLDVKIAEDFANGAEDPELRNMEDPVIDPKRSVKITIHSLNGRDISGISKKPEEKEVLLRPGIFKVKKAYREKNGPFIVEIEELDPAKLNAEDKVKLANSEAKRMKRIKDELREAGEPPLQTLAKLWNTRHKDWKKSGYLNKADIKPELFEGGD